MPTTMLRGMLLRMDLNRDHAHVRDRDRGRGPRRASRSQLDAFDSEEDTGTTGMPGIAKRSANEDTGTTGMPGYREPSMARLQRQRIRPPDVMREGALRVQLLERERVRRAARRPAGAAAARGEWSPWPPPPARRGGCTSPVSLPAH